MESFKEIIIEYEKGKLYKFKLDKLYLLHYTHDHKNVDIFINGKKIKEL